VFDDTTNQGIAAFRAGDRQLARRLFVEAINEEPDNDLAWLWLSGCYDELGHRLYCIHRALEINPSNTYALRALSQLQQEYQQLIAVTPPEFISPVTAQVEEFEPAGNVVQDMRTAVVTSEVVDPTRPTPVTPRVATVSQTSRKVATTAPAKRPGLKPTQIVLLIFLITFGLVLLAGAGAYLLNTMFPPEQIGVVPQAVFETPTSILVSLPPTWTPEPIEKSVSPTVRITSTRNPTPTFPTINAPILLPSSTPPGPVLATATLAAGATQQTTPGGGAVTQTQASTRAPTQGTVSGLQVHFIDVGQGEAIFIQAPNGATALIDGGGENSGVVDYLKNEGVDSLDVVVASVPLSEHVGGLIPVFDSFEIGTIVASAQEQYTALYDDFITAVSETDAEYFEVIRGDQVPFGNLVFDVVSPPEEIANSLPNTSVVLRLTFGSISFLFTGDIRALAEEEILESGEEVQAYLLKIPDHASSAANSEPFIDRVNPKVAIYFPGPGGPDAGVLDLLRSKGATVYGTDGEGSIVVTTNGQTVQVQP